MKNRAFTFAAVFLMTLSAFSCGSTEQRAEKAENTQAATMETQTTAPTDAAEKSDKKGSADLSFGMMKYVKKSRRASADSAAFSLKNAMSSVIIDNEQKFANDMIYSNTGVGEFNKQIHETYFDPDDELDYIVKMDEYGYPKWLLCCEGKKKRDYVGVYGDVEDAEEIKDMKWKDVLEKFGFEYGEYTDIKLEKAEHIQPSASTNIKYEGLDDLDLLALTIVWEYNIGTSQKPFYLYGKWGKDEPFTADLPWKAPEHGDMEFVIEMSGFQIGRVFCWEIGSDKSQVGMVNINGERYYLSESSWDEILSYFGYTQGEYIEY